MFCLNWSLLSELQNDDFLTRAFLHLPLGIQCSFLSENPPLPFIYLLLVWTHELLHFLVIYNLLLYLLWCSNFPKFGQWKFFQADLCILVAYPPTFPSFFFFFNISLLSSITRCYFGCILYLSLLSPGISHFSKAP